MKNRAFRKFVASIGVAAMVMSTATNAMSPAVTRAESAQELEGQQNDSQEQGGQEDPVAQSSDDTNGAPFADAEPMAVSSEDSQDSQEAAGPSESSDSNGENGTEGSSGENTNASAGSTSTDASGAGSQDATGTMSGATNGTVGTTNSTITETTENSGTINGATDTFANGTSTDASTGTTTGENGEASGDNAEASTKEITSVITEDIDLGTYPAGEAPAYAQLELPDEIEVKVDEEKQNVTVTWNGEETYHPDQAGTYIFSSELDKEWNKDENGNARYQLAEKVELPKASVRVEKKAESTEDSKAEVKSDNKTENKTDAKLDIKEDNKTDVKAVNKSEGKTEEKSDNKSEVTTKPETTKETTKDTSKENTKETSKKDSASKDKTKDETEDETKGEAKNEAKEENKTDTKDETAKADQKKKVTNAASLKAVYVAEDGTILCGTVGLNGDSFTISDKAKSFNGYELKTVTLGEEELPQDTAFTRNTRTTETKEEIHTEASYTYTMDGAEHEIAAGDTATITFTYAQKEEVTPEIASIEVTGEAVDTTGAAIQGDYAFPLAVGTNDLSKTAPYIQGYEYQYAEIGTDKITSIAKEVLEAGKYAYYVDGELLKENTKITYVYQEDEDYTERLTGTCGNLTVTVSASKEAKLPEGTAVQVTPVASARIPQILDKVSALLGKNAQSITGVLYDIALVKDGMEIQPKTPVHVTMKFDGGIPWNVPEGKQITDTAIVHLHGGVADVVTKDTENAEFETEGFSIYGMVAMYEGETGTPVHSGTEDLANLVISADLYLEGSDTLVSGEWNVKANTDYKIRLSFAEEDNNNDKQFSSSGNLYYQLPKGVNITKAQKGPGSISVEDKDGQFRLSYTYEIGIDGRIKIILNKNDENYTRFLSCGNASLYIDFSAQFTQTETGKISFGTVPKTVTVDNNASLTVEKTGNYNPATNKMEYTVTVTSSGYNTNVEVTDTMTGSLLTFDGINLISASSSRTKDNSLEKMTKESQGNNGFKVVIPSMKDGETVTLTYTASVNLSELQADKDGNTKEETGNTVSAKSDQDTEPKTQEFHHAVSAYTSIEKNVDTAVGNVISETTKDGQTKYYRIIPWKIEYNKNRYVSVAGNKIIDEIKTTGPHMEYTGDGLKVDVTKEDGTNETRTIPWNNLTAYNAQNGWTYTIPAGDTGKYSYTITYNTKVDVTDIITNEKVQNEAKDDKGHTSGPKETTVGPRDENKAELTKTGVVNGDQADWTITIKVPASGLTKAELIDEIPSIWKDGNLIKDQYNNDLSVSGAPKGTTYQITLLDKDGKTTSNAQEVAKIKVVFYQDEKKTTLGIAGNGTSLTDVTVTLSTKFNPKWPSDTEYQRQHTNKVNLDTLHDEATVSPSQKKITKSVVEQPAKITLKNGKEVWAYQFYVEFEGVTGDTLSFADTFDTTYLKLLRYSDEPSNYQNRDANRIYIEENGSWKWPYWAQDKQDQTYFTTTENGFSFSYSGLPHDAVKNPKNKFRVGYILYIDPDKVSDLNQITALNKGEYSFTNTATSDGFGSTNTSFKYSHATLTKENTVKYEPDATNPTSATAHFTIEANKEGFKINGGNDLTLTDTLGDNLSLIYSTISVIPEGALVKRQTQGRTITFTIKDETPVTITYDAKIIKMTGNSSDKVSFSNTASLQGESVTCKGEATYKSATGGTAKNYSIKLIKVDSQNEATTLSGAVFGLYKDADGKDPVQNTTQSPVTNATFTTNDQGIVVIAGDSHAFGWTLEAGETYYIKELTAPTGYVLDPKTYQFSISATDQPDYERYIYYNGDELRIRNQKEKDVYTGFRLEFTKTGSDAAHKEKLAGAKFALKYGDKVLAEATSGADGKVSLEVTGEKTKEILGEKPEADTKCDLILEETGVPEGYKKAADVTVKVKSGKSTGENADHATQTTYSWSVEESGIPESGKIENEKKTGADVYTGFRLEFTKTGSDAAHKEKLAGAKFALKYGDKVLAEATSGADGKVSLEVTGEKTKEILGEKPEADTKCDLILEETGVPEGYKKAADVTVKVKSGKSTGENADHATQTTYSWSVEESGIPESGKIENEKKTGADVYTGFRLEFTKTGSDAAHKEKLAGAKFALKYGDKVLAEATSGADGKVSLEVTGEKTKEILGEKPEADTKCDLILEETGVPEGYKKAADVTVKVKSGKSTGENADHATQTTYSWSVEESGIPESGKIENEKKTGADVYTGFRLEFTKTGSDAAHKEKLAGAKFALKYGDKVLAEATSGADGKVSLEVTGEKTKEILGEKPEADTKCDLILEETGVPEGYKKAADVTVKVKSGKSTGENADHATQTTYSWSVEESGIPESGKIVNQRAEYESASITKSWDDDNNRDNKRPASIDVKLTAKVDGTEILELSKTATLKAANGWKDSWSDLPKYHDGKLVEYSADELNTPAGYTKSVSGDLEKGFTITNRYTPETVQVSGSKNWNDDGNAAGTRPGSITIRLYANGSEIDHKTVTEKDGWSWNWTGLNRYNTDHKEISYTISEDAVDGYTSSISGYNVTNTVNKPQVGSVILTKVDATTGTALAGAVFDLYRANNTKVGTYTTNAGGVLRVDGLTFGDYYFVETKAPEGYALESQRAAFTINAATTVSAPASVRVTNKPVDEKIGVSAAKVWDDENNTDGVRPSSVTFRLFADGVEIGSAQASEANGWTVSFGNLPKTRNGVAISYAVKEDEVGNYYEASYETGLGSDGSYVFTVKNYRETDKHYEERTGSVRGANRNKPSNGGVAGAGRGRGTGDESDMTVYGTVSGASLLALIVWMIARRKRAGKGTK